MDADFPTKTPARRKREWASKYQVDRSAAQALGACEQVQEWLEQLAQLPDLPFEAEHCVDQATSELLTVRTYLRLAKRKAQ
jgi:hypothetical protein